MAIRLHFLFVLDIWKYIIHCILATMYCGLYYLLVMIEIGCQNIDDWIEDALYEASSYHQVPAHLRVMNSFFRKCWKIIMQAIACVYNVHSFTCDSHCCQLSANAELIASSHLDGPAPDYCFN